MEIQIFLTSCYHYKIISTPHCPPRITLATTSVTIINNQGLGADRRRKPTYTVLPQSLYGRKTFGTRHIWPCHSYFIVATHLGLSDTIRLMLMWSVHTASWHAFSDKKSGIYVKNRNAISNKTVVILLTFFLSTQTMRFKQFYADYSRASSRAGVSRFDIKMSQSSRHNQITMQSLVQLTHPALQLTK